MLENLHIENYALIAASDISFDSGFTVITGETGAGKSILLGALALVLGQRADSHVLFDPQRKCVVEAAFNISKLSLQQFFADNDLDYDDHLILRRELSPAGKSRAFVNDTPVTLPLLRSIAQQLIDIHSQHETLTLVGSAFQTRLLDTFNGGKEAFSDYSAAYANYMALKRHLEQLSAADAQAKRDLDYNQFLFDELSNAALSDGEQEELEQESSLLANTESIKQSLSAVLLSCDSEEGSALSLLNAARSQLSKVASFHKDLDELYSRLDSNIIELGDILATLSSIDSNLNFSPDRQEFVNTRLDLIYRLQKKHSVQSVAELLAIQQELEGKIQQAEGMDSQVRQAMEEVDKAYAAVQDKAEKLSAIRRLSAQYVEQQLLPTLAQLGMKEARLSVVVSPAKELGPLGGDIVSFLFNANRGGELRELSKVASGGELSRLMLAIKSLVTQQSLLPTIIFDEIDTGVSGDISVRVGNILHSMASHLQVIAITHLPQIAARASAHLKVFKQVDESGLKTVSRIKPLATDERIHEVAVMLSSEPPSPSALQTASELMSDNIK